MFLNYNPDLRHPLDYPYSIQVFPSLLVGFHGTDFPTFKRYYGDAKTAFALLFSFDSSRLRYHLCHTLILVLQYRVDIDT